MLFKISQKLRRYASYKSTHEKLSMTLSVAANTIDGLSHECAVYQKALELLCQDTGTVYAEYVAAARREILDAAVRRMESVR